MMQELQIPNGYFQLWKMHLNALQLVFEMAKHIRAEHFGVLGYSDQSALARAYKAYAGLTLMQRRKQLK